MQNVRQQIAGAISELDNIRNAPMMAKLGMLDGGLAQLSVALICIGERIDMQTEAIAHLHKGLTDLQPYADEGTGT